MSLSALLDRDCILQRLVTTVDYYGTPQKPTLETIQRLKCAATKQTIDYSQNMPQADTVKAYRLYFLKDAPVKDGDIAIVSDVGKLRLAEPYQPRGHHMEVDGFWEGEA